MSLFSIQGKTDQENEVFRTAATPYKTTAVVPLQAMSDQTNKHKEILQGAPEISKNDYDKGQKASFAGTLRSRYETSRIEGRAAAQAKAVVTTRQAQQRSLTLLAPTFKANQERHRDRMIQLAKSKRLASHLTLDKSDSATAATKDTSNGRRIEATAQTGNKKAVVASRRDHDASSRPTKRTTNVSPPNTHSSLSTSATQGTVAPPHHAPTRLPTSDRRRAVIAKSSKQPKSSRKGSSNASATLNKVSGDENRQEQVAPTMMPVLHRRRQRTDACDSAEKVQEQRDTTHGSPILYGSSASFAMAAFLSQPTTNVPPAAPLSSPQPTKTIRPAFIVPIR
jgi:hypothetical protein